MSIRTNNPKCPLLVGTYNDFPVPLPECVFPLQLSRIRRLGLCSHNQETRVPFKTCLSSALAAFLLFLSRANVRIPE
jgi:hypothetical protein